MAETRLYLTFGVDREQFALAIERVREVLDMRPIARLPHAPPEMLGLVDVRGVGLPVVDMRAKFGFAPVAATKLTRIIVADVSLGDESRSVGLLADRVFAVSDLSGGALEPPPSIGAGWRADDVVGVGRDGGAFVIVLDLDRLLGTTRLAASDAAAVAA